MKLNGKEIEITNVEEFFLVMDTFEKTILSTDTSKGIPETEEFVVFAVSDHAIGLPGGCIDKLSPYFTYK